MYLDYDSLEITHMWANRYNPHDYNARYPDKERQVFGIDWDSNIGYGQCTFYIEDDGSRIVVDSELMGKKFVDLLLDKLKEKIEIEE